MVTKDAFTLNSSRCKLVTNEAVLCILVKKIGIIFSRALNQVLSRNAKHLQITDIVVYLISSELFEIQCYNKASVRCPVYIYIVRVYVSNMFCWNSKEEWQLISSKQVNILFSVKTLRSLVLTQSALGWLLLYYYRLIPEKSGQSILSINWSRTNWMMINEANLVEVIYYPFLYNVVVLPMSDFKLVLRILFCFANYGWG